MKMNVSIFAVLFSLYAFVSTADNMRVTPVGYRIGSSGEIADFAKSVVTVSPDDTSIATPDDPVELAAMPDKDYKVVCWQKFDIDPRARTAKPIEEFGAGSGTVSVSVNTNVTWMYITIVVKYDPVRTVKAALSSFGRGKVTVDPAKETYQKGDVVTLTAEPAEGYSFVRWSDGNVDHARTIVIDKNVDLKAYIEPKSSRVTFSPGEGAVLGVTEKRVSYNSAYGELPVPTRMGAKFSGWADADGRTITAKTTVSRDADHVLYAFWGELLYEVAWDFTGRGNGKVEGAGTYAYGSQPTLKAVPYEGSSFAGWTDGVTLNPRRITVLSNALYVAAFDVATYDVTFTYRDAAGNLVTKGPTTVEHGGEVDPPSVPEWPEHTFKNWSTEEYRKVTRDLAVEAIYDLETYDVAFAYCDGQGNSVTTMPQHVTAGGKANPPDRSVVDNWEGHAFKGWQPDYNVIREDTLCEAIYETKTYTITFSYCDAKGEELQHVETVKHGEKVSFDYAESVKNLWTGHVFKHWSCGGQVIKDIGNVIATGDMQISAAYEGYARITYAPNKGEGEMPMQVYTNYSGDVQLAPNAFTRTGYLFVGWSTDGSNDPVYDDGDTVAVSDGTALALTACWTPITYTLKFDGNGGTCKLDPKTLTYDEVKVIEYNKQNAPQDVERANCDFLFWSRDPVETNEIFRTTRSYPWEAVLTVVNLTTTLDDVVTLYAIWKGSSQTVTINGKSVELEYGSELNEPENPEPKTGYAFTGSWKTNNDVIVEFPIVVTGNFNLDPVWAANKYEISFDSAGGSAIASVTNEYDAAITAPAAPTRSGYSFVGWFEGESAFAFGKMPARNVSLTAHWTANAYTVKFDPGEGSGTMADQSFVYDVAQALSANGFLAPAGKVFACWTNAVNSTTYSDGQTVLNLTSAADGSFTLYATWTEAPSYTAVFHGTGGTNATGAATYEQTIECGKATALTPNRFTRTGYGYTGWADVEGGDVTHTNGEVVTDLATEDATKDLYAVWTANRYWVKFEPNGADGGTMAAQAFTYDVVQALTKNTFTRTGYGFAGWAAAEGGDVTYVDGAFVSNLTAEANATNTLWAVWTVKRYAITFDSAGGSAVNVQSNDYGATLTLPMPTREGYAFGGWYEGNDPFTSTTMPARDVALTAHWSDPNTYTVRFNGNGGTNETGKSTYEQPFAYDEEKALTSNAFVLIGHTFANWTNAAGHAYADGAKVKNLVSSGVVDLYAKWTAIEYECLFDGQSDGKKKYGETITRTDPSKTGYTFKGWTLNGTDIVDLATFTMPNHDVSFTSKWEAITYTIKFDGNGATGTMASTNVKYDVEIALPSNTYVWAGHEFVGWSADKNAGERMWEDGQKVSNLTNQTGTVTLFAVWQETGNPLAIALGLDANFDVEVSAKDAWTVIGEPKEKKGLVRSSSSPDGTLTLDIPGSGILDFYFDYGVAFENDLVVSFGGLEIATYSQTGNHKITMKKTGKLTFSEAPDKGSWTLKNFKWTPAE